MHAAWGKQISGSAEAEQVSKGGLPCVLSGTRPVAGGVAVADNPSMTARVSRAVAAGVDTSELSISEVTIAEDAVAGVAASGTDSEMDGAIGIPMFPGRNAIAGWVASIRPKNSVLQGTWYPMSMTVGYLMLRGAGGRGVTFAFFDASTISSIHCSAARSNFGTDMSMRTRSEMQRAKKGNSAVGN